MNGKNKRRFSLDVVIKPSQFLFQDHQLENFQRILLENAPKWCEQARAYRSRNEQQPVNLLDPVALEAAIRCRAKRQEPMRKALEEQLGPPRYPRFVGGLELRGADDSLTVVVHVDELPLRPIIDSWNFGNDLSLQVRRSKVEGVDAVSWSADVFRQLCEVLSPAHGDAQCWDEFDAKNMSHEGGGLKAIGVDVSRYLPGIYWMNFFGKPYCELMGREKLLSAPAEEVREINDGVLLRLAKDPRDWATDAYKEVERRVLNHIGPQYFFSREDPDRTTFGPSFEFPKG